MDAIDLLKKDHDTVRELFLRYRGGGGITGLFKRTTGMIEPRQQRRDLSRICRELTLHTRIEEKLFYPAVRALGDDALDAMLDEALEEHAGVKRQVRELAKRTRAAETLTDDVARLEQDVEHHAGEEERRMLPRVGDLMPSAERAALGGRMQRLKRADGRRDRARAAKDGMTSDATARRAGGTRTRPRQSTKKGPQRATQTGRARSRTKRKTAAGRQRG